MKTNPVKGTLDYAPREAAIRDYLQNTILSVYRRYGFARIVTPALEDAENIDKSDGGDNLNLVFHIMKRGDKLDKAVAAGNIKDLSDLGLRYDLTLPLSRYVANNQGNINYPFKVIQMGNVYRAERPQKGRLREFVQCDIDVMGSSAPYIEVELLHVAAQALSAIGIKKFTIKVNDRRVLRGMLQGMGFAPEALDTVSVSFDKLDKIGVDGIRTELIEKNQPAEAIEALCQNLSQGALDLAQMRSQVKETDALDNLSKIIELAQELAKKDGEKDPELSYRVQYDPSLVRGQGYYTGTVFEIASDEFRGAIAGGGRYDNLIGKFIKQDIPAVGISIGFERIFSILMEQNFTIPGEKPHLVLFYEGQDFSQAFEKAEELRSDYIVNLQEMPKKLGPTLNRYKADGYSYFVNFSRSPDVNPLD